MIKRWLSYFLLNFFEYCKSRHCERSDAIFLQIMKRLRHFVRNDRLYFGRRNGLCFGRRNGLCFGRRNGLCFGRRNGLCFGRRVLIGNRLRWISAVLALCLIASAQAALSLDHILNQVKLTQASTTLAFTQTRHLHFLDHPIESKGSLRFKKPDTLIQNTVSPTPRQLIINKDTLSLHTPGQAPRTVKLKNYPTVWAFITTFRALLNGNSAFFKRYFHVNVTGTSNTWQVHLTPKPKVNLRFKQLTLQGQGATLKQIRLDYANGDSLIQRYGKSAS
jgi:outer membrane lipoprotein-sorting protein